MAPTAPPLISFLYYWFLLKILPPHPPITASYIYLFNSDVAHTLLITLIWLLLLLLLLLLFCILCSFFILYFLALWAFLPLIVQFFGRIIDNLTAVSNPSLLSLTFLSYHRKNKRILTIILKIVNQLHNIYKIKNF